LRRKAPGLPYIGTHLVLRSCLLDANVYPKQLKLEQRGAVVAASDPVAPQVIA